MILINRDRKGAVTNKLTHLIIKSLMYTFIFLHAPE